VSFSIVIPTVGRASLLTLLASLAAADGPRPDRIVVVDDRAGARAPLVPGVLGWPSGLLEMRATGGRGPAAARNAGWRATSSPWVVFLDDDVRVVAGWLHDLRHDLDQPDDVAAVQARIVVPLPGERRPTDWERGTAGLESAHWITADIAYRRPVLERVGGFDERFPRAFREDADLALRVQDAGYELRRGRRTTEHPVRAAPWHASVGQQRGNADDVLMHRLHGPDWRARAHAPLGRRPLHVVTTAALAAAVGAGVAGRSRFASRAVLLWLGLSAQFAWRRIAPGPRGHREIGRMAVTSVLIPPLAVVHWLAGYWRHRGLTRSPEPALIQAVLVDRDGTIVHDVPYNGDPEAVRVVADVDSALRRLRRAGLKLGVVTNQSGIARGLLDGEQVGAVNSRIDALLGPFDTWQVCPHGAEDGCGCRKPLPGLVLAAAEALAVPVERCVVIGDTRADVDAGTAAGVAAALLVPNDATRPEEVAAAALTAATFSAAVDDILARFEVAS
jgi:histidinol-phosphate phosphatase family protein